MNDLWTSRYFDCEQDLLQMQNLLMVARSQTDDWRYAHIGELLFTFFMVACHLDPKEHIRLWHAGDKLAGYAILSEDPAFDWQVLPEYEWRGIEEEALTWAETCLDELCERDAQRWGHPIVSGARQDNARRIAFMEQHGFCQGGEFSEVNLILSLDSPIPEPDAPPGYHVRVVNEAGEFSKRADAHREVWLPWTVGNVSDEDYIKFTQLPGYDRQLDLVAVAPDGVIAAFVNGWIDPVNCIGDFGPVGARLAYRRKGLTRTVLLEGLQRMKARGMRRVCVSTGISNTPAIQLYQSVGFRVVNSYLEFLQRGKKHGNPLP